MIGTLIGALAGFIGGWFDNVFMRLMDVLLAFPSLLLAIALVAILRADHSGRQPVAAGSGAVCDRLCVDSGVCAHRAGQRDDKSEQDFVAADRALGASPSALVVPAHFAQRADAVDGARTLGIATGILDAAALGFLGLGQQPPYPEWGTMLGRSATVCLTRRTC